MIDFLLELCDIVMYGFDGDGRLRDFLVVFDPFISKDLSDFVLRDTIPFQILV